MKAEPKVHKRDRFYDKPTCGMKSTRLTSDDAEVTCVTCRGWLPFWKKKEAPNA